MSVLDEMEAPVQGAYNKITNMLPGWLTEEAPATPPNMQPPEPAATADGMSAEAPVTPTAATSAASPTPPIAVADKQQAPLPQRPTWSQYAPAEPHGLAKFGHALAAMHPYTNEFFNERPLAAREQAYNAATKEYDTEFEQGLKERGEERQGNMMTVTGPNGQILQIPQKDYEKYLQSQGTNTSKEKQVAETNASHEKVGEERNASNEKRTEETNESRENINQWTNTSREQIEKGRERLGEMKAKMQQQKVSPFVEREFGSLNDSYERLQTMQKNLEDGLKGDQQAMLSLLANHMGMTLGQIKGTRAGKALIEEAEDSAPYLGRLQARFDENGYLSGLVLTPEQMQSMVSLAQNKFSLDEQRFTDIQNWEGARGGAPAPEHLGGPKGHFKEF